MENKYTVFLLLKEQLIGFSFGNRKEVKMSVARTVAVGTAIFSCAGALAYAAGRHFGFEYSDVLAAASIVWAAIGYAAYLAASR